jgi:hypothetical protein
LPLLFNFALGYVIKKVEENKAVLELNETHQLLVYADDVKCIRWKYKYHKEKCKYSVRG